MKRIAWMGLLLTAPLYAQQHGVDFDGAEGAPAQHAFSHQGSTWSGGRIESEVAPGLFATGSRHYEVSRDGAKVEFAAPVTQVKFYYVHGFGIAPGTARAYDAGGALLGRIDSRKATTLAAPAGFAGFDTGAPIARIEFDGGAIDHVTWKADAPAALRWGSGINGTWLITSSAPYLAGQGFALEYLPANNQVFVAWFTWDTTQPARQRWLVGNGTATVDGAQLQLYAPEGGRFNGASAVQQPAIGTLRLTFTDCDTGEAQFSLPAENLAGTVPIRSARALLAGHACE